MLLDGQRRFSRRFAMPFSFERKPRMAGTARACRAVIVARELDAGLGEEALRALQFLQFTTAGLLDEDNDLRVALVELYERDRSLARSADGSPTHAQGRFSTSDGPVRYTAPSVIFEHENGSRAEVGGFQPGRAPGKLFSPIAGDFVASRWWTTSSGATAGCLDRARSESAARRQRLRRRGAGHARVEITGGERVARAGAVADRLDG